jgi:CheY-like chemotaxis protein
MPVYRAAGEVAAAPPDQPRAAGTAAFGAAGRRHLVVYIEDNPSNIAFMKDLVADFNQVDLITAPTAEIGIELVRARQPDAVIMDINLPGMSGYEATRPLRDWPETHRIPVVALSAAAMAGDKRRIEGSGFYRYLTKPVKVDELAAVLEELLVPPAS